MNPLLIGLIILLAWAIAAMLLLLVLGYAGRNADRLDLLGQRRAAENRQDTTAIDQIDAHLRDLDAARGESPISNKNTA